MPLPPAPTKRAALLSPDALDAPARSPSRGVRKSENADSSEKPPVLDLFEDRATGGGERPVAFKGKEPASPDESGASSYKKESTLVSSTNNLAGPANLVFFGFVVAATGETLSF